MNTHLSIIVFLLQIFTAKMQIVRVTSNRPSLLATGVPVGSTGDLVDVVRLGEPPTVFTSLVKSTGPTNLVIRDNGIPSTQGFYWLRLRQP
jgi:hypothetical protein